jgi:hypothetical protein
MMIASVEDTMIQMKRFKVLAFSAIALSLVFSFAFAAGSVEKARRCSMTLSWVLIMGDEGHGCLSQVPERQGDEKAGPRVLVSGQPVFTAGND